MSQALALVEVEESINGLAWNVITPRVSSFLCTHNMTH
jgi:hypothetical protein